MSHKVFHLPDLGEGLTEAEVVSWLVGPGDTVVVDQPIAVVETAKAQVELPCPYAGSVVTLHGEAGHVVDVGAPFITVDVDVPADGITGGGASEASDVAVDTYREEERAGSGAVLIGYGPADGSDDPAAGAVGPPAPTRRRRRREPSLVP